MEFLTNIYKKDLHFYNFVIEQMGREHFYIEYKVFYLSNNEKSYLPDSLGLYLVDNYYTSKCFFDKLNYYLKKYMIEYPFDEIFFNNNINTLSFYGIEIKNLMKNNLIYNVNAFKLLGLSIFEKWYLLKDYELYKIKKNGELFYDLLNLETFNNKKMIKEIPKNNIFIYDKLINDFDNIFILVDGFDENNKKQNHKFLVSEYKKEIAEQILSEYELEFVLNSKELFKTDVFFSLLNNLTFTFNDLSIIRKNNIIDFELPFCNENKKYKINFAYKSYETFKLIQTDKTKLDINKDILIEIK